MKRRRYALDRRIATLAVALAAVGLLVTVGVAAAPPVPRPEPDADAARELVALLRAGEQGSWMVTYDFERRLAGGRTLAVPMREARNEELHVLTAGTSMKFETPNRAYDCTLVDARAACHEVDRTRELPESEVLRVAVNTGVYGVSQLPNRTVAGEPARCFLILPTGPGTLPDIGTETAVCLSNDGIALDERVARATGTTDQRVATAVVRDVTDEQIRSVVRSFDPSGGAVPR
jgi:hypothetical protein